MNDEDATRLQMSDGTCLRIEGANADQVAAILNEKLAVDGLRGSPATGPIGNGGDETPLAMPAMNFGKEPLGSHCQAEGEAPLALPVMNFGSAKA